LSWFVSQAFTLIAISGNAGWIEVYALIDLEFTENVGELRGNSYSL
jgi:hypothetical protein